jgi:hypothetical protein
LSASLPPLPSCRLHRNASVAQCGFGVKRFFKNLSCLVGQAAQLRRPSVADFAVGVSIVSFKFPSPRPQRQENLLGPSCFSWVVAWSLLSLQWLQLPWFRWEVEAALALRYGFLFSLPLWIAFSMPMLPPVVTVFLCRAIP